MPAPSARSATRAVAVLDYFTTNPGRSFTLSELSVAVGASPSSLSSVLQALIDKGYLVRHPRHKTYELGPALGAVGHAAMARNPVVNLARPVLARLAAKSDAECIGSVVSGEEILVLAVEGRASQRTRGITVGVRIPFMPPFGEIWLAHSTPAEVERWWERGITDPGDVADGASRDSADDLARLQATLEQARAQGYLVISHSEHLSTFGAAVDAYTQRPTKEGLRNRVHDLAASVGSGYTLLHDDPAATYRAEMIVAPVFGADGSVVMAISHMPHSAQTGAEIRRTADLVVDAGFELTRAIGGRAPHPAAHREAS